VHYSKATSRITGIRLTVYPIGGASKTSESTFFAKSLQIEADGSYLVHLLPRPEPKPVPRLKHEYPSTR
jgi:hypothetical protein